MPGTLHIYSCKSGELLPIHKHYCIALVVIELLITCFQDLPNRNYEFSTIRDHSELGIRKTW